MHFQENYGQEDLYDDVLTSGSNNINNSEGNAPSDHNQETETNGSYQVHSIPRRFQLYIGNLTWWTTDQNIMDAVASVGVGDFQEVKFFENRANGQSKGFCVITLGSESSMRMVMDNLPKKDLNGQTPVVTLPTKQALNQFESQQKTRPTPPNGPPNQKPMGMMGNHPNMPPMMNPRMMSRNPMRGPMPMHNSGMMRRMPGNGPPPMNGPPMNNMPPRFQNNWNNGPPGPRPPMNGMPNQRPPMNHIRMDMGMNRPPGMNMGPRGFGPGGVQRGPPPQMHPGGFNQQPVNMPPNMPPRAPGPMNPAPHVNPAFFNQSSMPPNIPGAPPNPHFNQQNPRPMNWNPQQPPSVAQPPISEAEFEEIMGRNRTVSSSAIARAVSDAAAGEYSSAIETLATAISLIKQSKVANDERCKIIITSLQDTLQSIEAKSLNRRDRSRSRERRRRRERSNSRSYRRSRSREHRDHRDRGGRDE